jgi:putative hydrolase
LDRDIGEIAQAGAAALEDLPGVGRSIAGALMQLLQTGRWPFLEHLRGVADPVHVFQQIPGVGPQLAKRIHDQLGVSTLQELEVAAHQGRLSEVPGLGPRRAMMVRAALADLLSRIRPPDAHKVHEPDVALLLDVDSEYRERAHELHKIAPRRFNPEREAWLPVLHTRRGEWIFTALFSNTARAHELGKTHDWVVIFFHSDQDLQSQCTIVTETQAHLRGLRVVRGREHECEVFYGANRDPALRPS